MDARACFGELFAKSRTLRVSCRQLLPPGGVMPSKLCCVQTTELQRDAHMHMHMHMLHVAQHRLSTPTAFSTSRTPALCW
jgi:hypothetical protein